MRQTKRFLDATRQGCCLLAPATSGGGSGQVIVGNIGSAERLKYGVVGSHVNLTSRIQSFTIGGQILASESTRHEVG
jgi:class 3 adenylate cyclase